MTDPLAGVPVNSRAHSNKVIPLAAAKASLKRRKLTSDEYKIARDQARALTGYDPATSIIAKMTTLAALTKVADLLTGGPLTLPADAEIKEALAINEEIRKRLLSRQLTFGKP